MCAAWGYRTRIYVVAFCVFIQTFVHLAFIVLFWQLWNCKLTPSSSYGYSMMWGYMAFFYRQRCITDIRNFNFPPEINFVVADAKYLEKLTSTVSTVSTVSTIEPCNKTTTVISQPDFGIERKINFILALLYKKSRRMAWRSTTTTTVPSCAKGTNESMTDGSIILPPIPKLSEHMKGFFDVAKDFFILDPPPPTSRYSWNKHVREAESNSMEPRLDEDLDYIDKLKSINEVMDMININNPDTTEASNIYRMPDLQESHPITRNIRQILNKNYDNIDYLAIIEKHILNEYDMYNKHDTDRKKLKTDQGILRQYFSKYVKKTIRDLLNVFNATNKSGSIGKIGGLNQLKHFSEVVFKLPSEFSLTQAITYFLKEFGDLYDSEKINNAKKIFKRLITLNENNSLTRLWNNIMKMDDIFETNFTQLKTFSDPYNETEYKKSLVIMRDVINDTHKYNPNEIMSYFEHREEVYFNATMKGLNHVIKLVEDFLDINIEKQIRHLIDKFKSFNFDLAIKQFSNAINKMALSFITKKDFIKKRNEETENVDKNVIEAWKSFANKLSDFNDNLKYILASAKNITNKGVLPKRQATLYGLVSDLWRGVFNKNVMMKIVDAVNDMLEEIYNNPNRSYLRNRSIISRIRHFFKFWRQLGDMAGSLLGPLQFIASLFGSNGKVLVDILQFLVFRLFNVFYWVEFITEQVKGIVRVIRAWIRWFLTIKWPNVTVHLPTWPPWLLKKFKWSPTSPNLTYWYTYAPPRPKLPIQLPENAPANTNMYDCIMPYLVLDPLWLITSIVIILGGVIKVRGSSSIFFYLPWILVTTAELIADLYCTFYFGIAILRTKHFYDYLAFLGVLNMMDVRNRTLIHFGDYHYDYVKPSIFFTLFYGRFFLIWILNILKLYEITHILMRVLGETPTMSKFLVRPICRPITFFEDEHCYED